MKQQTYLTSTRGLHFSGLWKRGLLEKGSLQKSSFAGDSRKSRDSANSRDATETLHGLN